MNFTFSHPHYLFFLFAIPLLFLIHFLALSNRKKKALKFANFDAIAKIEGIDFFSKNVIVLAFYVVIVTLVCFSLSGLTFHTTMKSSSFTFVLAVDVSQSMEADDFNPNRLAAAKKEAIEFVNNAPFDVKMGVITFAGSTRIEQDLTDRKDDLGLAISGIEVGSYGGTDLYEAVLTSSNMLKFQEHKAVIILSDGQINVGNLDDAIDYANNNDVIVHTIGIGTLEGGSTKVSYSKIDEDSLKSLSYGTGGVYAAARDKTNLTSAFNQIYDLTERKVAIDLFDYLLISAIILTLIVFFLSNTRYVNLP